MTVQDRPVEAIGGRLRGIEAGRRTGASLLLETETEEAGGTETGRPTADGDLAEKEIGASEQPGRSERI